MFSPVIVVSALVIFSVSHVDAASVWKVTAPSGGTLYLGGSIHALHSADYPLPTAYNRAFDASTHLSFEVDRAKLDSSAESLSLIIFAVENRPLLAVR